MRAPCTFSARADARQEQTDQCDCTHLDCAHECRFGYSLPPTDPYCSINRIRRVIPCCFGGYDEEAFFGLTMRDMHSLAKRRSVLHLLRADGAYLVVSFTDYNPHGKRAACQHITGISSPISVSVRIGRVNPGWALRLSGTH